MNKSFFILVILSLLTSIKLVAQDNNEPKYAKDSLIILYEPVLDSLLLNKSIFEILPSRDSGDRLNLELIQSVLMKDIMSFYHRSNNRKQFNGYRLRIFFDSSQNAREKAEALLSEFKLKYPEIPAYISFDSPFFKLAVGDCRNKSEALALKKIISNDYPSAFIIKDKINYPLKVKEIIR